MLSLLVSVITAGNMLAGGAVASAADSDDIEIIMTEVTEVTLDPQYETDYKTAFFERETVRSIAAGKKYGLKADKTDTTTFKFTASKDMTLTLDFLKAQKGRTVFVYDKNRKGIVPLKSSADYIFSWKDLRFDDMTGTTLRADNKNTTASVSYNLKKGTYYINISDAELYEDITFKVSTGAYDKTVSANAFPCAGDNLAAAKKSAKSLKSGKSTSYTNEGIFKFSKSKAGTLKLNIKSTSLVFVYNDKGELFLPEMSGTGEDDFGLWMFNYPVRTTTVKENAVLNYKLPKGNYYIELSYFDEKWNGSDKKVSFSAKF